MCSLPSRCESRPPGGVTLRLRLRKNHNAALSNADADMEIMLRCIRSLVVHGGLQALGKWIKNDCRLKGVRSEGTWLEEWPS